MDINELINKARQDLSENISTDSFRRYDIKIAAILEHSMITPDADYAQLKKFCEEAMEYNFRNVSVPPCFVQEAANILDATNVKVSTAIAFPMGISTTQIKVTEAIEAVALGAEEIDMPINIGLFKEGKTNYIFNDIKSVVSAVNEKAIIKVVLDAGKLTKEEQIKLSILAKHAGAKFLKVINSNGGVKLEDVILARKCIGNMGIKADGGVRDTKKVRDLLKAGATTIGASRSVQLVKG